LGAVTLAGLVAASSATAASTPYTVTGHNLRLVATGVPTATSFAFGDGQVFVGGAGDTDYQTRGGGVYVLRGRHARKLSGSPTHVTGLAWHDAALYVAGDRRLRRWSGWNGARFTHRRTIYRGPATMTGFDGIGFGANGRLYAGVGVGANDDDDHGPTTDAYAREILSFNAAGGNLRVFARGIRQPWQMAFPPGSSSPYVSDLGPDFLASEPNPPDMILRVTSGQNYGFPTCDWSVPAACATFAKPLQLLAPHTDPMGLVVAGNRLYFNEFSSRNPPQVVWMPRSGGTIHKLATGFSDAIVGLGEHGGRLYVGQISGQIYSFKP
jgi:glucose/arabinose dehydrogenase